MEDLSEFNHPDPSPAQSFSAICRADEVNLITQVRGKYDSTSIEDLGWNINFVGQIHRVKLAAFTNPLTAQSYLDYFNDWWELEGDDRHHISELHWTDMSNLLLVAISGHRRLLAILSQEVVHTYVKATVFPDIDPSAAALKQLSENNYNRPPAHRKADAIYRLHQLFKDHGKDVSQASLARQLGVRPSTVRSALRFGSLPSPIQNDIRDDGCLLKFGHGIWLERYAEYLRSKYKNKGKSSEFISKQVREILQNKVDQIITENLNVDTFAERISRYFDDGKGQVQFAFGPVNDKRRQRKVLARKLIVNLGGQRDYLKEALRHVQNGSIPEVFSPKSPANQSREIIRFVRFLLENIEFALVLLDELGGGKSDNLVADEVIRRLETLQDNLSSGELSKSSAPQG